MTSYFHAFIRTHHITSRKKVAVLKAAAKKLEVTALLRSGGVPGLMYVNGRTLDDVRRWVDTVHDLRYKDYQLVAPPEAWEDNSSQNAGENASGSLEEVESVRAMASTMENRGLLDWWRRAMGYTGG